MKVVDLISNQSHIIVLLYRGAQQVSRPRAEVAENTRQQAGECVT